MGSGEPAGDVLPPLKGDRTSTGPSRRVEITAIDAEPQTLPDTTFPSVPARMAWVIGSACPRLFVGPAVQEKIAFGVDDLAVRGRRGLSRRAGVKHDSGGVPKSDSTRCPRGLAHLPTAYPVAAESTAVADMLAKSFPPTVRTSVAARRRASARASPPLLRARQVKPAAPPPSPQRTDMLANDVRRGLAVAVLRRD